MQNRDFSTRIAHYLGLWLKDALSQAVAPLTDQAAFLSYIGVFVSLAFLGPRWGPDGQIDAAVAGSRAILVFLCSLPVFILLSALRAVFRVAKQDRDLGKWRGDRFVYRHRQQVFMISVDASDNFALHRFSIPRVPKGAWVWFAVEHDRTEIAAPIATALVAPDDISEKAWNREHHPTGCMQASEGGELSLRIQVQEQASISTVRVYVTAWSAAVSPTR